MGVVEQEDIEQLCQTLEMDAQDEKVRKIINYREKMFFVLIFIGAAQYLGGAASTET